MKNNSKVFSIDWFRVDLDKDSDDDEFFTKNWSSEDSIVSTGFSNSFGASFFLFFNILEAFDLDLDALLEVDVGILGI